MKHLRMIKRKLIRCFVLYLKQYISMGLEDSIPTIVLRVKDVKINLIFIIELHTDILFKQHLKILWSTLLGFYLLGFFQLRFPFPTYFEIQENAACSAKFVKEEPHLKFCYSSSMCIFVLGKLNRNMLEVFFFAE